MSERENPLSRTSFCRNLNGRIWKNSDAGIIGQFFNELVEECVPIAEEDTVGIAFVKFVNRKVFRPHQGLVRAFDFGFGEFLLGLFGFQFAKSRIVYFVV